MRNRLRLAAWLFLGPLALNGYAGENHVNSVGPADAAKAPAPALPQLPSLPPAEASLNPSGADAAAALQPIISVPEAVTGQGDTQSLITQAKAVLAAIARGSNDIQKAVANDPTGQDAEAKLQALFSGAQGGRGGASWGGRSGEILNDEGIPIGGRTAAYYREVRRLVARLEGMGLNVAESLNVMDDTYSEIRSKLVAIKAVARENNIDLANAHLEETLTWIDGVIEDDAGRRTAVYTQRVFFHKASDPQSEIAEGLRRIEKTLDQTKAQFSRGGVAEKELGHLDQVVLAFDARGYKEIKDYIKSREAEFGPRFRFAFVDEMAPVPNGVEAVRQELRQLAAEFPNDTRGLENIYDGVSYSRYVGLLLELKTIEYYADRGYTILESGRDFFGPDGKYKTEFDVIVRSPQGEILIVEAKSARVYLPLPEPGQTEKEVNEKGMQDVMRTKFLYKLEMYQDNRDIIVDYIRRHYGEGPIQIVFSVDVGGTSGRAASQGRLVWSSPEQRTLFNYLKSSASALSEKYGYPTSFLFLNSRPGEDPMLYYRDAGEAQPGDVKGKRRGRR